MKRLDSLSMIKLYYFLRKFYADVSTRKNFVNPKVISKKKESIF